ncbi:hypothetical protein MesoLj131a_33130 [Mesorhizobium sp. 131-2-1]|nr:hypothetical protein MesoLj131a_33130 [Mesorhizobium sp. 131-2-1]
MPPDEREPIRQVVVQQSDLSFGTPGQSQQAAEYQSPCRAGVDNRNSDLCAQWKAADAAQQSAMWAGIGTLIGGLTFAAAVAAAIYARRAAKHTETGAIAANKTLAHAEQTSKRELRAYLAVVPDGINQLIGTTEAMGHVLLQNVGKLPARNVSLFVYMEMSERNVEPKYRRADFQTPGGRSETERVVHPNGSMRQGCYNAHRIPIKEIFEAVDHNIYVWGIAYYDDGYGCPRYTRFCHRYTTASRNRTINPTREATETRVVIAPDKARYHTRGNDAD